MNAPRMCPICGTGSIEPIVLDAQSSVSSSGQPVTVPDLDAYRCGVGHLFIIPLIGQRVQEAPACSKSGVPMEFTLEIPIGTGICETCAERGRPNEPVYKMGMCEFCHKGLPHPKATREQLVTERTGGWTGRRHPLPDDKTAPTG